MDAVVDGMCTNIEAYGPWFESAIGEELTRAVGRDGVLTLTGPLAMSELCIRCCTCTLTCSWTDFRILGIDFYAAKLGRDSSRTMGILLAAVQCMVPSPQRDMWLIMMTICGPERLI